MISEQVLERIALAKERVQELSKETLAGKYATYLSHLSKLLDQCFLVYEKAIEGSFHELSLENKIKIHDSLYQELKGESYLTSYANPAYAVEQFGEKEGQYLCYFYAKIRGAILYSYSGKTEQLLLLAELFLQLYMELSDHDESYRALKELAYYDTYDYSDIRAEWALDEMLDANEAFYSDMVMLADFSKDDFLYEYGEHISDNEVKMLHFLREKSKDELAAMARTYTEGYRVGFEKAGIDLATKKYVNIRYPIGMEPMVREAVLQFEDMGLIPVIYHRGNTQMTGVTTTPANRQYIYDHRFDDGLYLNHAILKKRLSEQKRGFEKRKELASLYAGPACIEVFGEKPYNPVSKPENIKYSEEQEKLSIDYKRDYMIMQNDYIPGDQYSFTIIAYPLPEIGDNFEEIFNATMEVNLLDSKAYEQIQQYLIDALDQGKYVTVTGRGKNKTNMKIMLHPLNDPEKETIFENCSADVNIPVGEVFTSPILTGTEGTLHVTSVYLNELPYKELSLFFKDGKITDYSCQNYDSEEENKKYIKENLLNNRDTLPIGEFAIGTNTTAYVMGQKYKIEPILPILIAEKTGPHFAIGDTCYSMSEDVVVKNPDGKEVVAKDNECSLLRTTKIEDAYFNCHTDITIPYTELGDIMVHKKNGETITLIEKGRFVLPGTEVLNEVLNELNELNESED